MTQQNHYFRRVAREPSASTIRGYECYFVQGMTSCTSASAAPSAATAAVTTPSTAMAIEMSTTAAPAGGVNTSSPTVVAPLPSLEAAVDRRSRVAVPADTLALRVVAHGSTAPVGTASSRGEEASLRSTARARQARRGEAEGALSISPYTNTHIC